MNSNKYKILLVEDDIVDQIAFKRYLQSEHLPYEYTIAGSVAEAEKKISSEKFEAIIADYLLGDGTAFDVLELVKDGTPIIFLTGAGNEIVAVNAIKSGAYDYMIKDGDRNYLNFINVTLQNAIRHRRSDEKLKLAEQKIDKLSWVASKTDNAIIIANKEGKIEWVNEGFTRLTQYMLEDVVGTSGEILRKGQQTGLTYGSEEYTILHNEKRSVTYENLNYTKEGIAYWAITTLTPALNKEGEIEQIIAIDSDITIRKQMEEELVVAKRIAEDSLQRVKETLRELMEAQKKLEDTVKIKEKFLANVSHEIRTPMNGVIGLTEILLKTKLTPEQREYLTTIKKSGDTLLVVINDILDLSKMEAGKMTFEKIPMKLSSIFDTIKDLFSVRAIEKNIDIKAILDKQIPEYILGDPVRINQIIMNLVSNAVKFTKTGYVAMEAKLKEEKENSVKLELSVTDTGCGIPENKLNSIFLDFTQVNAETTREYGGTGLGLAISKRLIELQGGSIGVTSKVNEGSVFSIVMEFDKCKEVVNIVQEEEVLSNHETLNLDVLLVEDNPVNTLLAEKILRDWDCNVDTAENGQIALDKVASKKYDIVLMDIKMPVMDGYEATAQIRKMNAPVNQIPIIALTAHAATWEVERCINSGMDDFITKPFNSKELRKKLIKCTAHLRPEKKESNSNNQKEPDIIKNNNGVSTNKNYDLSILEETSVGNKQFIAKMIKIFIDETEREMTNLKMQASTQNWDSIYHIAHKIKPSCQTIGIDNVVPLLTQLEDHCKNKQMLESVPSLIDQIDAILSEVITELKKNI